MESQRKRSEFIIKKKLKFVQYKISDFKIYIKISHFIIAQLLLLHFFTQNPSYYKILPSNEKNIQYLSQSIEQIQMKNKSISLSDNQKSYITKLINFKMKPLKNKYKQLPPSEITNVLKCNNKILNRQSSSSSIYSSRKAQNRHSFNVFLQKELANDFQLKLLKEGILESPIIKQTLQKNTLLKKIKMQIDVKKKLFKEKAKVDLWNKGYKDLQNVQKYSMDYLVNVLDRYSQKQSILKTEIMDKTLKDYQLTEQWENFFNKQNEPIHVQKEKKRKQSSTHVRFQSQGFGQNGLKGYIRLFKQPKYLNDIAKSSSTQKSLFQLNRQLSQKIDIQKYRQEGEGIDPRVKKFKELQKIIYQKGDEYEQKIQLKNKQSSLANAKIRMKQNHTKLVKLVKTLKSSKQQLFQQQK